MRPLLTNIASLIVGAAIGAFIMWGVSPEPSVEYVPVPAGAVTVDGLPSCPTEDSPSCVWQHPRTGLFYVNGPETGQPGVR
jgi:hypothetical protein